MKTALKTFFNFINRRQERDAENRKKFLAKSENFRLLLTANSKALETMAEMQESLNSGDISGVSQVRAQSLTTAAAVRQMIERICLMAPGKYDDLRDAFNEIVQKMDHAMRVKVVRHGGPMILHMNEIREDSRFETGTKMAMLGEIRAALGLRVPEGFTITASAFHRFMEYSGLSDEIGRLIQIHGVRGLEELNELEESIKHAIDIASLPPELKKAMRDACELMGNHPLAVRSSALNEDSEWASYAGQFVSKLGVPPHQLSEAYREVLASLYSPTAMTYTLNRGLREDELIMSVGCLEMVRAVAGGVVYSRLPMSNGDRKVVVSAVPGLPCSVVDGSTLADTWAVDRETMTILEREIVEKRIRNTLRSDGSVYREKIDGQAALAPAVSDDVVVRLARSAVSIEEYFKTPQDIEWALNENGRIVILQCRPLSICETATISPSANDADRLYIMLSGCIPASPGVASGYVFKVEGNEDMLRFPDGAVLLARNAKPQLSALLPQASALITEYGSAAGHLANVAREFGVPALIGAPGAMERLAGVSIVTVNGSTGTVYLGRRAGQLNGAYASKGPRRQTEVSRVMRKVLDFVAPLTLTDPESDEFTPQNCRTLHDITRFCHEKGVNEMFADSAKPTGNARRLMSERALQYWLVDIGGGTGGADDDKTVSVDDVRSNVMRALWHGMTAVDWEGPPSIDLGGFMSVLTSAAQNPALSPGAANAMGERNYFIVGRNYCNLQSRFGFHYCTIEGFAGDDPNENYALFQFKGGGADMVRRNTRAWLVADILERHGFIVEVKDDALFSRLEGVSRQAVEQAMTMLGYLLIHTRQIDMNMADPEAVHRYRMKFETDIEDIMTSDGWGKTLQAVTL
jgi:pyruvate,water dikinase